MFTLFPSLLSYSFFVPTLLRLAVATVFVYLILHHFKHKKAVAQEIKWFGHEVAIWLVGLLLLAEAAVAAAFFAGYLTQLAAILAALGFAKMAVLRRKLPTYAPFSPLSYVLLIVICIALLVLGAGAFAFDLPL